MSRPDCSSVTERFLTRRRSPALFRAITIWSVMVFKTITSLEPQACGLVSINSKRPTCSDPSLSARASTEVTLNCARASRTAARSGPVCTSAIMTVPPRLMATSWTLVTIFSRIRGSLGLITSPQYSLTLVVCKPGLRMAITQRLTFQCVPISLAPVTITASALFCL